MEARSPTLPRTGTMRVSPDTRRETTDRERTKIRGPSVSDRPSSFLFGFCNIVILQELQQLRTTHFEITTELQPRVNQAFRKGIGLVNVVVGSLLDRRRRHGSHCGVFERHSCAGANARISPRVSCLGFALSVISASPQSRLFGFRNTNRE